MLSLPGDVDAETFLRDYWQKKPLLMRSAVPASAFSLSPDELAGLACEDGVESRIVIEHDPSHHTLHHGPFSEADFADLPESGWTLLVQDVDKYLPEVAALMEGFDFVPGWRIDDIMVSFATDRGGVGPHTDAYDVFLMQAMGRRRWRLSFRDYRDEDLLPDHELRVLSHFDTDVDWELAPGDVLYLPPGVAHWGTALGDCMTYSLGFRSPSQQDLAAEWFQHLVTLGSEQRPGDPTDLHGGSLWELTAGVYRGAAALIDALPGTRSREFRYWLGCHLTEPKPQFQLEPPADEWTTDSLRALLTRGVGLRRHPFARVAWSEFDEQTVALFVQGEGLTVSNTLRPMVRRIAERRRLSPDTLAGASAAEMTLLLTLLNEGALEADGDRR